jgi:hypothetical protein
MFQREIMIVNNDIMGLCEYGNKYLVTYKNFFIGTIIFLGKALHHEVIKDKIFFIL